MKQYVLKLSGAAAIALLLSSSLFAQDQDDAQEKVLNDKMKTDKLNEGDQIIIRRKGDKDIKVTVEIKAGKIFVDGKPVRIETDIIGYMRVRPDPGAHQIRADEFGVRIPESGRDGESCARTRP